MLLLTLNSQARTVRVMHKLLWAQRLLLPLLLYVCVIVAE
jgi:hypothetical protein